MGEGKKNKMVALIRSGAVLSARLVSGELHVVSESGAKERWATKQLSSGGNNTVLEIVAQNLVARFSTEPMGLEEQRKYVDEVEVQTALGGLRLSPEPLCVLHFVESQECSFKSEPYASLRVRMGIVMRKYDMALDAVLRSPASTAEVFIAGDGESRIVELFARASSHATCVDTKCANVMVALAPLEVVLIDLDVTFCGTEARAIVRCLGAPTMSESRALGIPVAQSTRTRARVSGATETERLILRSTLAWVPSERMICTTRGLVSSMPTLHESRTGGCIVILV